MAWVALSLLVALGVTGAAAGPAETETPLRILRADAIEGEEATGRIVALGNVVVEYRDYHITADVLEADIEERTATFRGRVTLTTPERTIQGTLLSLNLRTRAYTLEGGRIVIPPQDLQMGAAAPIYARGASIQGTPDRILIQGGGVTSCDLDRPHYLFNARRVSIVPAERLEARKVSLYALGHKLLTLPGLSIPLRTINEQSSRIVPTAGQSLDEGYYLKTAYFYVLGALLGNVRVDLMSRKGIGVGIDQPYNFQNNSGAVHLYQLSNRRERRQDTNARINHRQRLGQFSLQLGGDYRRNALPGRLPSSSSLFTDLSLSRYGGQGSSTDFGLNRSSNSFAGTTSGNWTGRLRHTQSFGKVRSTLNLNLSQPFGLAGASAGRLSSRLDLARTGGSVDVGLVVDRVDTFGGARSFFAGVQRLPELRIAADTSRMSRDGFFGRVFPLSAELSLGNLQEAGFSSLGTSTTGKTKRLRTYLHLSGAPQLTPMESKLSFYAPMDFHQVVYKQDEAQWILGTNPSLNYRLTESSSLTLSYSFLAQNGFTPFQFDYYPRYNNVSLGIRLGSGGRGLYSPRGGYSGAYPGYGTSAEEGLGPVTGYGGFSGARPGYGGLDPEAAGDASLSLSTGYDFENDIAQDLIVRAQYQPTAHHLVSLSSGYDWLGKRRFSGFGARSRLRDIRGRLRVDYGSGFQFSLGTLWDTNRDRFSSIRASLNARLGRHWNVQSLYGKTTTGFGPSQPYTQVLLTRDLHCVEASALYTEETTYGRRQRDFRVFLSIKAFPVNKEFGVSRSGQYLTTDIGDIY